MEEKYGVMIKVPLYRKIYAAKERLFGDLDPDTVATRVVMADKLFADGEIAEALELARRALQNKVQLYGAQDPRTQAAKIRIAVMLVADGTVERASRIARETMEWWQSNRENGDWEGRDDFLKDYGADLAQVLLKIGDAATSEEIAREVLLIRNLKLGPMDPDTIISKKDLIAALCALGKLEEAEELGRATLKELGPDDPSSSMIMAELAAVLDASGQSDQAARLRNQSVTSEAMTDYVEYIEEGSEISEYNADMNIPSFMKLELDEDDMPRQLRFTYVDETFCIGCTYCATQAQNTFGMLEDTGRARSYLQCYDTPEIVTEAIDMCPVSCIAYVDLDDLIILETERESLFIDGYNGLNSMMIGGAMKAVNKKSRAKFSTMNVCRACPQNGCKNCPMFGEGRNPAYIAKQKALEERRAARLGVKTVETEVLDTVYEPDETFDAVFATDETEEDETVQDESVSGVAVPSDVGVTEEKTEELLDLLFQGDGIEDES